MKRFRLRPRHSDEQLAAIYAEPHEHSGWPDHRIRVRATIALASHIDAGTVADLSCGDGVIAASIHTGRLILGDVAPGHEVTGPIESTIHEIDPVDTFVCSETIEHLDDPGTVLAAIRSKSRHLILTTPIDNWDDGNIEHYWAWDREAVEDLARRAGWNTVDVFAALDCRTMGGYLTGMWVLS